MKGNKAVVGVFTFMDDALRAIELAKSYNLDVNVYSPVPNHDLDHATSDERGPLRFVSGVGALTGLIGGFALAILCSLDYPIRVSAKSIVSIPGFVVIGYECTILFGAIATLVSILWFCRLPDVFRKVGYNERFSKDKFGVVVGCEASRTDEIKAKLLDIGADEVEVQDGI